MTTQTFKFFSILVFSFIYFSKANATTIYVSTTATGSGNGSSWANAYLDLQDALVASQYGDEVWVAKGTYLPTSTTNRNISFEIPNGVKLYGGFFGNETSLNQRDWQLNETNLSGDIGFTDDETDNSYAVVYLSDVDSNTILDGFVIMDGNANSNSPTPPTSARSKAGGGLYITSNIMGFATAPSIRNCDFIVNNALWHGGAVMVFNKQNFIVNPFFESCTFSANSSKLGGAVNIYGGNDGDDLVFLNCVFEANFAFNGGAMHYYNLYGTHQLVLDSCLFDVNFADDVGGAYFQEVTNPGNTQLLVNKCTFSNNSANEGGGIASISFVDSSNIIINKTLFNDNFANVAGSIQCYYDNLSISSTEFNGEFAVESASCIYTTDGSVNLYGCTFDKCISDDGWLLYIPSSNILDTFRVINSTFYNNETGLGILPISDDFNYSIANSVFLGNSLNAQGKVFTANGPNSFYANIYNCLFDVPDDTYLAVSPITVGSGNLYNLDPQFVDPDNGDFHLHSCSPARNAGSNAVVDSLGILTDIEGSPRIQGGTVDIGAYESPAFEAASATVTAQPCGASGIGTVELLLENGCPPYFLDWGTGSTVSDISLALIDLPVGTHSVTVTDGRMESDIVAVTLTAAPAITANAVASPVNCATGAGGTASVEAIGGTGSFGFQWSSGGNTATVTGLAEGAYQVTVTDANGCTATDSVDVATQGNLQLGIDISPITCAGDSDGTATVQPVGGTMPFAWLWDSGEDTPTVDNLAGGSYAVTVTDALGCTGELVFTITPPTVIFVSIEVVQPACFGELGTATASATGGTGGHSFAWDNGAMAATTDLAPGLHTVTATDEHGCTATASVLITAPLALQADIVAQPPVLCFEASNGTLTILPSGGTPPYNWSDPTQNLLAGSYEITITDSNGCTLVAEANIGEYPEIAVTDTITDASDPTASDGSIVLESVTGGTGSGYTYQWSNGTTSQNLVGVPTGNYSLTVTDSQGCTASFTFFVDFETATGEKLPNPFRATIVPNPSGSSGAKLVLEAAVPTLSIRIFDAKGQLVASDEMATSEYALPKGLAAGTYWVVLSEGERRLALEWVLVR